MTTLTSSRSVWSELSRFFYSGMASPQLENGYTKIADELLEAISKWHLSSYECRVLLFLIRKTYGWNKKEDWISLSQFVLATGIRESHISRALNLLIKQNMVTKRGKIKQPQWSIQKDFDKWVRLPKGVRTHSSLPKGVRDLTKRGNSSLPKGGDTTNTITKDTLTKESGETTPAQEMNNFLSSEERQERLISGLTERGIPEVVARSEIKKFINYWSEKTKTGRKQRWETEKTFELRRRLTTWFSRIQTINKPQKNIHSSNPNL